MQRQPVYCHLCGRLIGGRRGETPLGELFHRGDWPPSVALQVCQECFYQKPRCRVCGMPMAELRPEGLCPDCMGGRGETPPGSCAQLQANQKSAHEKSIVSPRKEAKCRACGKPAGGSTFALDKAIYLPGVAPYCQTCLEKRPPCSVCGAPLTDDSWELSDGRVTCAFCHATAIYEPDQATEIYEEMKSVALDDLGLQLNVPTGLALVDLNQMAEVLEQSMDAHEWDAPTERTGGRSGSGVSSRRRPAGLPDRALAQRTLGLYVRRGMRRGIYVQSGLPCMLFLQTAAHEYAHAWQGENCPLLLASLTVAGSLAVEPHPAHEGFAEWVAYHVIGRYGYERGQERMLGRDDVYGKGLRWALDLESAQGPGGVIAACRRASTAESAHEESTV